MPPLKPEEHTRYVVTDETGKPLALANYSDGPDRGLMLRGNPVALFYRAQDAAKALERSRAYESSRGLDWSTARWRVRKSTLVIE